MNTKVSTTIEKITEVLNKNHFVKEDYDTTVSESEKYWFIHIYTQYIDCMTIKDLMNNTNVICIWPDEHEFVYTLNEKIPCTKTTIAILKYK